MKKLFFFTMIAVFCVPFVLSAGEAPSRVNSTCKSSSKVSVGVLHKKRSCFSLVSAFEFGFNELLSTDYGMYPLEDHGFLDLNNGKSIHFALYLVEARFPINRKRTFGISTGLGLAWDDYVFDGDLTLAKENGIVVPVPIDSKYKKSKLSTFSLQVPVVLGVELKEFTISGGVYGNLIVSQHTKYKKPKHKEKGLSYASMLQGGLTARIGFKGLSVFANYALTDLFKHDKGPGAQPLTVGIGLW